MLSALKVALAFSCAALLGAFLGSTASVPPAHAPPVYVDPELMTQALPGAQPFLKSGKLKNIAERSGRLQDGKHGLEELRREGYM